MTNYKILLYKNAVAFLYPSLYEGFGLPVIEAQFLGTPVITSNLEVACNSAYIINPYSVQDIYLGMKNVVFDKELRKKIINLGYDNANKFSWKNTALLLLKYLK